MTVLRITLISLLILAVSAVSCTSRSDQYMERITALRDEVRGSFSPKFDPIWIGREKKVEKARKEVMRLVAVMNNAIEAMDAFDPPLEMRSTHDQHKILFQDCKKALLRIHAEADQEKPSGKKAVKIYQEMTRRILELDARS